MKIQNILSLGIETIIFRNQGPKRNFTRIG